jgi:hypothetical protein
MMSTAATNANAAITIFVRVLIATSRLDRSPCGWWLR